MARYGVHKSVMKSIIATITYVDRAADTLSVGTFSIPSNKYGVSKSKTTKVSNPNDSWI